MRDLKLYQFVGIILFFAAVAFLVGLGKGLNADRGTLGWKVKFIIDQQFGKPPYQAGGDFTLHLKERYEARSEKHPAANKAWLRCDIEKYPLSLVGLTHEEIQDIQFNTCTWSPSEVPFEYEEK